MCGIAGLFGSGSIDIDAMLRALRHRGPDDSGQFAVPGAILGMTRLAIIDPSPAGHQPMLTLDGQVAIIFNGEIYNYREHRNALLAEGCKLRSASDTEVILELYLRHGDAFLDHLRGMFAIAIFDRRRGPGRERLLLARDHFGIKPLVYVAVPGGLIFASELKALLASSRVPPIIDPLALQDYLAFGSVGRPRTILAGVQTLPPAHLMIVEGSAIRVSRYWSLGGDRVSGVRSLPMPELVEIVRTALDQSLERQLVADVPVGAFLSGGIDSSLLVAMMVRRHGTVRTFSVGFAAEEKSLDESDDASLVARYLQTDHSPVLVTGGDLCRVIDRLGAALDQPSLDGVNSFFVAEAAASCVKVAISGTGGDEMFAGYPWFAAMQDWQTGQERLPSRAALRRLFASLSRQRLAPDLMKRWSGADFVGAYAAHFQIFGSAGVQAMLHPSLRGNSAGRTIDRFTTSDTLAGLGPIERTTALSLAAYTGDQLLRDIDAMTMAHSLEVRVPFLDPDLADLALSLPDAAKIGPPDRSSPPGSYAASGMKAILIEIGRQFLPADFHKRRKRGFSLPLSQWLRGPLREALHDTLSADRVEARGWLDPKAVGTILADFDRGTSDWTKPWLCLVLELWGRQVLDRGVEVRAGA
jgi:asparagine synthase (glutamine-hydrolysing)